LFAGCTEGQLLARTMVGRIMRYGKPTISIMPISHFLDCKTLLVTSFNSFKQSYNALFNVKP